MLEFLEDIIGSSQFKEPIEQLSKRVEELNEARGEKVCFPYSVLSFDFIIENTCEETGVKSTGVQVIRQS